MSAGLVIPPHHVRPSDAKLRTLEDLLHELGDVPPHRVLMQPPPGTATEQDLLRLIEAEKVLVEMVNGTLVEKPVGWIEGVIAMTVGRLIANFVDEHDLGVVSGADGTLKMRGGNIRVPDVTFVAWSSMPGGAMSREAVPMLPPDLAVEVLSESNTRTEMELKRRDYFASGTKLVWQIDPSDRTAAVYRPGAPDEPQLIETAGALDGEDVLRGFRLPLVDVFAKLDRPPT